MGGRGFGDISHLDRNLAEMLRKLVLVLSRTCGVDDDRQCSQHSGRCSYLERRIDTDWRELVLSKSGDYVHLILLYTVKI